MKDTRFIKSIRLRNLLSFGPDNEELELKPLNVLIGPNASGKSNFIEAISILQATPRNISKPFREGGGAREWIWKGGGNTSFPMIEATISNKPSRRYSFIKYSIDLDIDKDSLFVDEEIIKPDVTRKINDFFYKYINGKALAKIKKSKEISLILRTNENLTSTKEFNEHQSILYQLKGYKSYPEITRLGRNLNSIKIYNNWNVGKNNICRIPQYTDLPSDFLSEDFKNLALVINELESKKETQDLIAEKLRVLYDDVERIITKIVGGPIQIFIQERVLNDLIPATRLSDGTLRYLCLLTILCHPEPPPLICLEEPEIGLHPDIMPTIAELLIEASKRTQLIVTTHSDALVSALSETPESVVVCEHDDEGTHMRRLEKDKLEAWLEKYTLGDLWMKGEIGGTRW